MQTFEGGQKAPHSNSIAALRNAIEAAGILLLYGETGEPAGIARKDVGGEVNTLMFNKTGELAGIIRRPRGSRPI